VKREQSLHFESLPEPRYGLEREQSFHFDPLTQQRYERKHEQYVHCDLSPQPRYRLDPNAETFHPKETQTTPISIDHNVNHLFVQLDSGENIPKWQCAEKFAL
jgi:hypothetical protein